MHLRRLLPTLLLAAAPALTAPDDPLAPFRFMAGCWAAEPAPGKRIEENWTAPAGGIMLATGRTLRDGKLREFEFLRIVKDEKGIAYLAQPNGQPPTRFGLVESRPGFARFANPAHDFPTEIVYRRADPGRLEAVVSGPRGEPREFRYRRVRCAAGGGPAAGTIAVTPTP